VKSSYLSFSRLEALLEELVSHYPQYVSIETIGNSWEQRPLYAVTLSDPEVNADQLPAILVQGTIHAREWIGVELLSYFMQYVTSRLDFDPKIRDLLKTTALYVIPCVNPDGFEYSRKHYSFWRKNRRDNGDGTFGVDLNRNFPVFFRESSDTNSNTYGGPNPLSEPESSALAQFVEAHPNITIALDYHSQGNVFFPAHRGRHEAEIESTDINTLCADMAKKIHQVTGRSYGIHRGRPPSNMVHGSAREFYFSKGILSTVVEVGSRNIPDYMKVMWHSVLEHVPALIKAWETTKAHAPDSPIRPESFTPSVVGFDQIQLAWDYPSDRHVVFEIYRSEQHKFATDSSTLISETRSNRFVDHPLKQHTLYFYQMRAREISTGTRGPFAPQVKVRTRARPGIQLCTLTPRCGFAGTTCEKIKPSNNDHFGTHSMFVGASKAHGQCIGGIVLDTSILPESAVITDAQFSIYPMNRVDATIENFGEWRFSLVQLSEPSDIYHYSKLSNAEVLARSPAIHSDAMTQGIWHRWPLERSDLVALVRGVQNGFVALRVEGPTDIPTGETSQIIQFDIGDGPFGGGSNFRPNLMIAYYDKPTEVTLHPSRITSIGQQSFSEGDLVVGFDPQGHKQYGGLHFNLGAIPTDTILTEAQIKLTNFSVLMDSNDLSFSIEAIDTPIDSYEHVKNRKKKSFVGYEISDQDLITQDNHVFRFDEQGLRYIKTLIESGDSLKLIVRVTSPDSHGIPDTQVVWAHKAADISLSLAHTTEQRISPDIMCNKLNSERLENYTKITWKLSRGNSEVALVRNRFHPPKSPSDGVPIYSGCDQTCEDRHASLKLGTWYSLFATNLYGDWILLESVWVGPTDNNHERVYTAPGTDQFEIFLDDNAESQTG
jgi:predicted deacylase